MCPVLSSFRSHHMRCISHHCHICLWQFRLLRMYSNRAGLLSFPYPDKTDRSVSDLFRCHCIADTHTFHLWANRSDVQRLPSYPITLPIKLKFFSWVFNMKVVLQPFRPVKNNEAWTESSHLQKTVLRKPCTRDMKTAAHAIAWEPSCYLLRTLNISQIYLIENQI